MVPRRWPAAPDVIWHIYSYLRCSTGDGGRESPWDRYPVSFEQIGPDSLF